MCIRDSEKRANLLNRWIGDDLDPEKIDAAIEILNKNKSPNKHWYTRKPVNSVASDSETNSDL